MRGRAWTLPVLGLLLVPVLAGCLTPGDDGPVAAADPPAARRPGEGLNVSRLTEPAYNVQPRFVERVTSTLDGIRLHVEVHLPDGEGPWPTILESSPYHVFEVNGRFEDTVPGGLLGDRALVDTYVPLGYAVVRAQVRGTGDSEGCMDMMGPKEQQDQYDLVEWIAAQEWSDGKVGMHGVSYVGTTPHEALIMAPPHLVTVVTVAGVTNQWRNVYQNGVPYSGRHYPLTYEAMDGLPPPTDVERGPAWLLNAAAGACGQEEAIAAMSPGRYEKGVYDAYWDARNLTKGAHRATASILYSQGFVDRAVNPSEAVHWFNELPVPKKAFFHQGGHQYPPREDYEDVEHAWFDHWLKGIDNGIMDTPTVEIIANTDKIRVAHEWPPAATTNLTYWLSPGTLDAAAPADGGDTYRTVPQLNGGTSAGEMPDPAPRTKLEYVSAELTEPTLVSGAVTFHLTATVNAPNVYFLSDLYDVHGDQWTWIAEGWFNGHLRDGFDRSAPFTPGETYELRFRFEPREYVLEPGHRLALRINGHDSGVFPFDPADPGSDVTVLYGADASRLVLPTLDPSVLHERPDGI